jgi:multidrug resistance efflux pump
MTSKIKIGDKVRIQLDGKFGEHAGWYEGKVIKIDPYSEHRSFYWVELNEEAQVILQIKQISVFNPKNIEKID